MVVFILGATLFGIISLVIVRGYFSLIRIIKNKCAKIVMIVSYLFLYFLLSAFVVVGPVFPVWLGEKLNIMQSSRESLYILGLSIIFISI